MTLFTYDQLWLQTHKFLVLGSRIQSFPGFLKSAGCKGPQSLSVNHFKVLGNFRKSLDNPYQTTVKTQILILCCLCEDPAISSNSPSAWSLKWRLCLLESETANPRTFLFWCLQEGVRTWTTAEAHAPHHHLPPPAKLWRAHYRIIVITLPFLTAGWDIYRERHGDWRNITEEYTKASNEGIFLSTAKRIKKNGVEDDLRGFFF